MQQFSMFNRLYIKEVKMMICLNS